MADSGKFVSIITPERVRYWKQTRFNPIRDLTADNLSRQIEEFNAGMLRRFAMTMDAIQRRDDVLKCVIPKRTAALTAYDWSIIKDPKAAPNVAEEHAAKLEYFYSNLRATHAVDRNQNRGFSLLVEQMMDALAKQYAAHEIIWRPTKDNLTATFNFVPLWFFENRTGTLRFLKDDFALEGEPLDDDWLITCGDGLMEACAVAYMYKLLPLKDWVMYCEKHGMPGVHGKTKHPVDSDGWKAVEAAVQAVAADFSCVTSMDDEISKIDFAATGTLPFQPLVERMDRALAALWRGADLSTISAGSGEGQGASLQGKEEHSLKSQDARLISETLNEQVDRKVIAYHFGDGTAPAAYVRIVIPEPRNVASDLQVDEFLTKHGVKLAKKETAERYGRKIAEDGDEVLEAAQAPPQPGMEDGNRLPAMSFANEAREQHGLLAASMRRAASAQAHVLEPLRERMQAVIDMPNEEAFRVALHNLREQLPAILHAINENPEGERAIADAMSAGFFNGLTQATVRRHASVRPRGSTRQPPKRNAAPQHFRTSTRN
jgi:phage gp29-like protein